MKVQLMLFALVAVATADPELMHVQAQLFAAFALVATATAAQSASLEFKTPSSKCSLDYENDKLTTDCTLGE
jgi:hypothetical protein